MTSQKKKNFSHLRKKFQVSRQNNITILKKETLKAKYTHASNF